MCLTGSEEVIDSIPIFSTLNYNSMKNIILLITLITTLSFNTQTKENFVLEEGKASWQKVYDTKKSKEEVISFFKSCGLFRLFRVEDGKIIATLKPQSFDKDDKDVVGTLPPGLVIKTNFSGNVIIDLKENKYRVIFKDILIIGNGELIKKGEKQTFEKHYVEKDGNSYRISFNKKPQSIYHLRFSELFLMEVEKKDDW